MQKPENPEATYSNTDPSHHEKNYIYTQLNAKQAKILI